MATDLNRHAIAGVAEVVGGQGGLPAVRVRGAAAEGLVYLHGAHVAAWKPAGMEEVLWMSAKSAFEPAKAIRGGVPVCFPWFGPKKDAAVHGFARVAVWELESIRHAAAGVTVALLLRSNEVTRGMWPGDFSLRHRVTFGAQLEMALELTNTGGAALTAEEALHTYFAVGDVRQARVKGLAGVTYVDKVDAAKQKLQEGDITITGETDRVYLNTRGAVVIEDAAKRRRITVGKENSLATVVWNPWIAKAKAMADFGDDEWPGMICVETCNVGPHAVSVAAGQTHVMTARVGVARY